MSLSVDKLAEAIMGELECFTDKITDGVKHAVDTVAKEVDAEIRAHISFRTRSGDYITSFRLAKTYEDGYHKVSTWYVKAPNYRLTHLLENGHYINKHGKTVGQAAAFPHIEYGERLAKTRLEELTVRVIQDAGH